MEVFKIKFSKILILITNKKNKGVFKSKNRGIFNSKGQFIILPEPDDILPKNILFFFAIILLLSLILKWSDLIYIGRKIIFYNEVVYSHENRKINIPELSTYLYYGKGKL